MALLWDKEIGDARAIPWLPRDARKNVDKRSVKMRATGEETSTWKGCMTAKRWNSPQLLLRIRLKRVLETLKGLDARSLQERKHIETEKSSL